MNEENNKIESTPLTIVGGPIAGGAIVAEWHAMGLGRNEGENLQTYLSRILQMDIYWCYDRISPKGELSDRDAKHIISTIFYYIEAAKKYPFPD